MFIMAINNGVFFSPEQEEDLIFITNDAGCMYDPISGMYVPVVLTPYLRSYKADAGGDVDKDYFNYNFNGLVEEGKFYNYFTGQIEEIVYNPTGWNTRPLDDGLYVLRSEEYDQDKLYSNFMPIFNKNGTFSATTNMPQHVNIVKILDYHLKERDAEIKVLEKKLEVYEALFNTDLNNLLTDIQTIKNALATPCANGVPLLPIWIPAYQGTSISKFNQWKTDFNTFKNDWLKKMFDYFGKIKDKIRGEK